MRRHFGISLVCGATLIAAPAIAQMRSTYVQTNLVSNQSGVASHTDPNLINAWGIAFGGTTGPWWVNTNGTGLSVLYDGTGAPYPSTGQLIVTIPPPAGSTGPSTPTGIVFSGTTDFQSAVFLFDTEDGTISSWTGGTSAVLKVTTPNAVYKGLTIAQLNGHNTLYAANFHNNRVDAFDTNFAPLALAAGAFKNPALPAGYAPFNVQNIGGMIWVTWAKQDSMQHDPVPGAGRGYVDEFTPDGTLVLSLDHGIWMNAPWGVVTAPASGFGELSGRLLVGQFGSGWIASFDPTSGQFKGFMRGASGLIAIDGLWGIRFGNGATGGPANALYFSAGPSSEANGLFGNLTLAQ
jgi:uncharacterized protein (TIGR03118 family)